MAPNTTEVWAKESAADTSRGLEARADPRVPSDALHDITTHGVRRSVDAGTPYGYHPHAETPVFFPESARCFSKHTIGSNG